MVFVKVRETYDLHTIQNKMSVIGVHTPTANIIKLHYPGLLMQCKSYRPVSCDVRLACASMLPLDPLGVGTAEGDVAPEDVFNPILYKAMSNHGMSQLEAYINSNNFAAGSGDIRGATLDSTTNAGFTPSGLNDFNLYYGLLSQTNEWKHANPQSGLSMSGLVPLVYETYQSIGDNTTAGAATSVPVLNSTDTAASPSYIPVQSFRGASHRMPFLNCTNIYIANSTTGEVAGARPGFVNGTVENYQLDVPAPRVFCGCIIVPPSRLHQLFFRMVCEWTLEFSSIRPISEITNFSGLATVGAVSHYMSYSFSSKDMMSEETNMVDTSEGSEIHKVM